MVDLGHAHHTQQGPGCGFDVLAGGLPHNKSPLAPRCRTLAAVRLYLFCACCASARELLKVGTGLWLQRRTSFSFSLISRLLSTLSRHVCITLTRRSLTFLAVRKPKACGRPSSYVLTRSLAFPYLRGSASKTEMLRCC